jgi:hypothetical protein
MEKEYLKKYLEFPGGNNESLLSYEQFSTESRGRGGQPYRPGELYK